MLIGQERQLLGESLKSIFLCIGLNVVSFPGLQAARNKNPIKNGRAKNNAHPYILKISVLRNIINTAEQATNITTNTVLKLRGCILFALNNSFKGSLLLSMII